MSISMFISMAQHPITTKLWSLWLVHSSLISHTHLL